MWWPLDAEVVMEGGRIIRTKNPTGHAVLVDCRFEIPCGKFAVRTLSSDWPEFMQACDVIGLHSHHLVIGLFAVQNTIAFREKFI